MRELYRTAVLVLSATAMQAQEPVRHDLPEALSTDDLIGRLGSNDVHEAAAAQVALSARPDAMRALGDVVLNGFRWATREQDPWIRWRALQVLAASGPAGAPAVRDLIVAHDAGYLPTSFHGTLATAIARSGIHAPDRDELRALLVRNRSRRNGLGETHRCLAIDGAADWTALRDGIDGLDDHRMPELMATFYALEDRAAQLGPHREEIRDRLTAWIEGRSRHEDWWERASERDARTLLTRASETLIAFAPEHPATWLGWCQRLFHWNPAERRVAAESLRELRSHDAFCWLAIAARHAPSADDAIRFLEVIRSYGPAAAPAVALLRPLMESTQEDVRRRATALVRLHTLEIDGADGSVVEARLVGCGAEVSRAERKALEDWLDADHGAARARIQRAPSVINEFDGGPTELRWVPVRAFPDARDPWRWGGGSIAAIEGAVLVTGEKPGPDRRRASGAEPWLVYLLPVPADRGDLPVDMDHYYPSPRMRESLVCVRASDVRDYRALEGQLDADNHRMLLVVGGEAIPLGDPRWPMLFNPGPLDQPWLTPLRDRIVGAIGPARRCMSR